MRAGIPVNKASDISRVIADYLISKFEDIHRAS